MARSTAMTRQLVRDCGTCLSFNGTSAKVIVASNATIQGMANLTLSFWFKAKDVGGANRKLFFKNGVYDIGLDSSGQLFAEVTGVNNFGIFSSRNMGDNTWHHFVITYDGSTAAAYLDGVSISSNAVVGTPSVASNANNLGFGQHVANGNEWYLGLLDEIRIYNTGITSTEVTALFYGVNPSSTPVAWWKFDEGSGTTANDSIGSSTGTITAATYSSDVFIKLRTAVTNRFQVSNFGSCLYFAGSNQYVTVPHNSVLNITTGITLEAWVRRNTLALAALERGIMAKQSAYNFIMKTDQKLRLEISKQGGGVASISSAINIPIGDWVHVCGTYDQANLRLYINGVATGTPVAETAAIATSSNVFNIGLHAQTPNSNWPGFIDNARVWNRALTAAEVADLYYNRLSTTSGLIALFKMDENTGITTTDSINSLVGTLTNSPVWSPNVRSIARAAA